MALKSLSAKVARFFKLLEGMDDPIGSHISFLERRIDTLECDLHHLRTDQEINFGSGAPEGIKMRIRNWWRRGSECALPTQSGHAHRNSCLGQLSCEQKSSGCPSQTKSCR